MKKLDMSSYRPYKNMGNYCELREIADKKVIWPRIDQWDPDNPDLRLRAITHDDIEAVTELWRASYPEVYGSIHEWVLHPGEYKDRIAFEENWEIDSVTMPHFVMVGEDTETEKIVLASLFTKWDQNLQVEASFFAIHPDSRKGKISTSIFSNLASIYKWLEDSGAEYVTVFCETWQNITQYIWFKRMGWKIAGIFPGNFTRFAGGQKEYRACTIHFYRFLNGGEKYSTLPEEWDLIPEIRDLWKQIEKTNVEFGEEGL